MQIQSYILSVIDMYVNAAAHKIEVIFKVMAILSICALLLMFSKSCSQGAKNGISFCLNMLVPSLFPFMALSSFLINSGLSQSIGKPFGRITKALFGLNGSFAPIIILSMIGGYPIGAKGISSLKNCGFAEENEAKKAVLFSVSAGPGFIVNFVGVSLFQSEKIGLIILVSQIISVFVLGIIINRFYKTNNNHNSFSEHNQEIAPFSSALVQSVLDSSKGILSICAFVVIFSAFTAIFDELIDDVMFENGLFCLLEVCEASNRISKTGTVEMLAFAVGFGGLCVHFQIFSALENIKVNKFLFFLIRIIQGVITALLTHIGLMLFPVEATVFSSATADEFTTFDGNAISGIVLIFVAVCFLLTFKKHNNYRCPPLN